MKSRLAACSRRHCLFGIAFAFAYILSIAAPRGAGAAETKTIRLRNEIIRTEATPKTAKGPQALVADAPVSGLFLVQLQGPPQTAWREELVRAGVTLLRFVPEDTFVARLDRASLARAWALPFVHWVGVYRADYKVHGKVREAITGKLLNNVASVRVLLAPGLGAADRLGVRRGMQRVSRETAHGFGTVMEGAATPGNSRRWPILRRCCGSSRPRRFGSSMRWR